MSRNCKIAFFGESGVGKTSLINQLLYGKFDPDEKPTLQPNCIPKSSEFYNRRTLHIYAIALE